MVIYFDLEFYVPKSQRSSKTKLVTNPANDKNYLLGGVFYSNGPFPSIPKEDEFEELWLWYQPSYAEGDTGNAEKELLEKIIHIFEEEAQFMQENYDTQSINTVGIGQARFDLPSLFVRSNYHQIKSEHELYRLLLGGFPVDLSNVGAGIVPTEKNFNLAPERAKNLFDYFDIPFDKSQGSDIWDFYDNFKYDKIEHRTRNEVKSTIQLYKKMSEYKKNQMD